MQKIILLIILMNFIIFKTSAQSVVDEDVHRKYWYYKSHLNNDFIKIGLGFGESIPFNEKLTIHNDNTASSTMGLGFNGAPKLHAGDATVRLGIYLSVLATEYRLLKNNNQNVSKVKHEIFCALNAINRLDRDAETFFDAPSPQNTPNLNGFFVRDDIPGNFVKNNYKHFNYFNNYDNSTPTTGVAPFTSTFTLPSTILQDHGFTQTDLSGVYRTGSSWHGSVESGDSSVFTPNVTTYKNALKGFEESQDQAYFLLMGLTLTSKLVDIGDSDNGAVFPITATPGQISLRNEAKEIATRLIQHMSNDALYLIRNPANKLALNPVLVQSLLSSTKPQFQNLVNTTNTTLQANQVLAFLADVVQTGGAPTFYAYSLDNLGNFIKNNQTLPYFWIPAVNGIINSFGSSPVISGANAFSGNLASYPFTPSNDFRGPISVMSTPFYMALMNSGGGPRVDFQAFMHSLAGTSNTIYDQATIVNIGIEATIASFNLMINLLPGTNVDLNRADSIAKTILPTNLANAFTILINAIKAANITTNPQSIAGAINTAINWVVQAKKVKTQLLYNSVLKNVTDERLFLNYATNPVFYSVDTSCMNPPQMLHIGSDQLFGIYLRDILHPIIASPPSGFRWLSTLAAPSRFLIKNIVQSQLASAPCNGNFNFGPNFLPPAPWGSSCNTDRFDAVWKRTNCLSHVNKGEYSGLDFMFLHNLFYLTEQPNNAGIKDFIDRDLITNFPINGSTFAHGTNQTYGAFEFIRASNVIAPSGQAVIRAGKQVTLLPGFTSQNGSDVKVKVEPFHDCDWNTSTGMLRNASTPYTSNASNGEISNYIYNTKKSDYKINESEKEVTNNKVHVYPNPNEGSFNIQFNLENKELVKVNVINVLGVSVYENELQTINDVLKVQLQNSSKGMYLLIATFENGQIFQKRIVTK